MILALFACTDVDRGAPGGSDPSSAFVGIETLGWDGADGLVATWSDGDAQILVDDLDGATIAEGSGRDGIGEVSGLAQGTYRVRVEAVGNDGGRRLRQRVGDERLVWAGEVPFAGARSVEGESTLLAVGGGDQDDGTAVMIVDVADPEAPVVRATIEDLGEVSDVEIADGILYVAVDTVVHPDAPYAVRIYDLADPSAPQEIAVIASSDDAAHTLAVGEGILYLTSTTNLCYSMWDVSDPAAPARVGEWAPPPPAGVHDQTWVDGELFAAWGRGWSIVDVADPAAPTLEAISEATWENPFVHNLWPTGDGRTLAVSEEAMGGGLRVYDVSDRSAPTLVSTWQVHLEHSIHNVVVRDNVAFAAWYVDGLLAIDLAVPSELALAGAYDTYTTGSEEPEDRADGSQWPNVSGATHVWPFGDVVAVSDQMRGLILLDFFPMTVEWQGAWSDR